MYFIKFTRLQMFKAYAFGSSPLQPLKLFIMCKKNNDPFFDTENGYFTPKTSSFKPVEGSDYDYRIYQRCISGKLTKARYKLLDRICRYYSRSPRYRCGHEYDCCGCMCGQRMSFAYKHNAVVITLTQSFNY